MAPWSITTLSTYLVSSRSAGSFTLLPEAIVAIYRSVASGQERHLGVLAALSADGGMHLTSHSAAKSTAAAALIGSAGLSARSASLGFVRIAFVSMILLVVGAENETLVALHTR